MQKENEELTKENDITRSYYQESSDYFVGLGSHSEIPKYLR